MRASDLAEIAADVAQALGLDPDMDQAEEAGMIVVAWWAEDGDHVLQLGGMQLTDPYWRCLCEDWLLERKFEFAAGIRYQAHEARAVSAVWRRMQLEKKCAF